LARITSNHNASTATIASVPRGEDEPVYHFPPGQGIRSLPGNAGDGFHNPYQGVNR